MLSTSTSATCGARSTGRSGPPNSRRSAVSATGCGPPRRPRADLAMSLRLRLAAIFAFGSAALIVVAGLAFLWQLHTSLAAALDSELRLRTAALAARQASGPLPPGSPADQTGRPHRPVPRGGAGRPGPPAGWGGGVLLGYRGHGPAAVARTAPAGGRGPADLHRRDRGGAAAAAGQ